MKDKNQAIIENFYDAVNSFQDLKRLSEFYTDDVKWHGLENSLMLPDLIMSFKDLQAKLTAYFDAVNASVEILQTIVEGETLAVRLRVKALHAGPLFGCQATGKTAEFDASAIFTLKDDKIQEEWNFLDIGCMALQFGFELRLPDGRPLEFPEVTQ